MNEYDAQMTHQIQHLDSSSFSTVQVTQTTVKSSSIILLLQINFLISTN